MYLSQYVDWDWLCIFGREEKLEDRTKCGRKVKIEKVRKRKKIVYHYTSNTGLVPCDHLKMGGEKDNKKNVMFKWDNNFLLKNKVV